VEAKRRKSFKTLYDWMAQCVRASRDRVPVLVVRADNEEMLFVVRARDCVGDVRCIQTRDMVDEENWKVIEQRKAGR
jgi:hypothetical protein